jgi:hypothetical protein
VVVPVPHFVADLLSPAELALAPEKGLNLPGVALALFPEPPESSAAPTARTRSTSPEPAAVTKPPEDGMVARFRRRLFNPLGSPRVAESERLQEAADLAQLDAATPAKTSTTAKTVNRQDKAAPRRDIGFKASLAEFLLINRLRARIRPQVAQPVQSPEMLQRAEKIIYVTCKHWFGDGDLRGSELGTRL